MLTELERMIEYRRHVGRLDAVEVQPLPTPEVRLTVVDETMPTEVPAELAGAVTWDSTADDWSLNRASAAQLEAYLAWRSAWESTFSLGTIRSLRELRHAVTAAGLSTTTGFGVLDRLVRDVALVGERFGARDIAALRSLLAEFTDQLREAGRTGVALVESSPTVRRTGLLRAWPAEPQSTELASRGTVTVRFSGDRLGVWFADDRAPIEDVRSFELGIEGAIIVDADGVEHVLDADASQALCAVAPEATAWRVRRVPEVLVWADVSAALEQAAESIAHSGNDASSCFGDVRHHALVHAN